MRPSCPRLRGPLDWETGLRAWEEPIGPWQIVSHSLREANGSWLETRSRKKQTNLLLSDEQKNLARALQSYRITLGFICTSTLLVVRPVRSTPACSFLSTPNFLQLNFTDACNSGAPFVTFLVNPYLTFPMIEKKKKKRPTNRDSDVTSCHGSTMQWHCHLGPRIKTRFDNLYIWTDRENSHVLSLPYTCNCL
jgi:hypothetical protein